MKKNILFLFITGVFLLYFAILPRDAFAKGGNSSKTESDFPALFLKTNTSCGSGFLTTDNKIITAAHVVRGCIKNDCSNIDVYYNGSRLILGNLKIYKVSYALDIAILEIENLKTSAIGDIKNAIDILALKEVYENDDIKILGFPRCEGFNEAKGTVTQSNDLFFSSSAKVYFGSSGSLVVNKDNQFVGMAIKAENISTSIKALILGSSLNANIIKGKYIKDLFSLSQKDILIYEIGVLNKYYSENIYKNFMPNRYPNTYMFMIMANNIFSNLPLYDTHNGSYLKNILASTYNAPFVLSNISYDRTLTKDEEDAEKLVLLYSFEKKGFTSSDFKALNEHTLISSLSTKSRSKKHQEELNYIIRSAKQNTKYSYTMSLIATSIWIACLVMLIVFFWIFTSGYYFSKFQGSRKNKMFKLILFFITWPISFFYYKNYLRKR